MVKDLSFKWAVGKGALKLWFSRWSFQRNPARHQERMWRRFQKRVLVHSPHYCDQAQVPHSSFDVIEKAEFMRYFNAINSVGMNREEAMNVALKAETQRDFSPMLNGITVGLSSGTSGNRGLFLASDDERALWVAAVLQRILGWSWRPRRVAFFLRANSNLYTAVGSKLVQFSFFDLLESLQKHMERLNSLQPHVLVGQPSLLVLLAKAQAQGVLRIKPAQVISVAEVLSPEDQECLERAFLVKVGQVYQCTEGLLGQTCSQGNIHLNEDWLIVEKVWLDGTRFVPIVTDCQRSTQPVVRYRMNDILHATECTCGSKMQAVSQIEGRMDDVLEFPGGRRVFPDFIRRAIIASHPGIEHYQIRQTTQFELEVFIDPPELYPHAKVALQELMSNLKIHEVSLTSSQSLHHHAGTKFRRVLSKH